MRIKLTTIKTKQTVAMLFISLSGMIMVAVMCYNIARQAILTETLNEFSQISIQESEKINGWLAKQKAILETTGFAIQTIDEYDQIAPIIKSVINEYPDIQNIIVGLEDNEGVFARDAATAAFKATERPWYILAVADKNETILSGPYRGTVSGLMMCTFARHMGIVDGREAVVSLDVPIGNLLAAVSDISIKQGENYAFLADQNGHIVTHPDDAFQPVDDNFIKMSDHPVYAEVYASRLRDEPYIKMVDYDGVYRYFVSADIQEVDWSLYIAVPEHVIYQGINSSIPKIVLASLAIMILAVFFIHRVIRIMIEKPLETLSEYAKEVRNGNLDVSFSKNRRDEIGILMNDFSEVANSVNMVIHDMNTMAAQHQENNLDFRLDETKYKGAYQDVVKGINDMVSVYVNNLTEIMALLESFGNGDFYASTKKYPGKLAAANESIENFRSNLIHVNKEIQMLAENALQGNLAVKADASGLGGDWLKMVEGLNHVLQAIMTPIQEAAEVLDALSKGKLHIQMVGEYQGDFALIKNSLNATIASLSVYIREISEILSQVADNNLDTYISIEFIGEFAAIKNSINTIIENQNRIIKKILLSAKEVNDGAKVVADISADTNSGTIKQNIAIEQLNQLIGFVNEQTRKNTENAQAADELSHKSVENASNGTNEMEKMVLSMNEIKNSSNNISSIINVINDIAFQTNLLALNAAVEAARAGTSGKGFAVVAEEVRNLATRSQVAAKESQVFIEEVLTKIDDGTQIAESTSEALDEIVANITGISSFVSDIFQSSREQSRLVGDISQNVDDITRAAQDVSKSSEESSATAEQLHSQSEFLNKLLQQFHTKRD